MIRKLLAGFALAAGLVLALPAPQAAAVSLLGPGSAATVKYVSDNLTTEVRWGRRGFGRGHFRAHRGWRPHRAWRPHRVWRHAYIAPRYYYAPPRRCRVVWTYYGPQRVCRPRFAW